MSRSRPPVTGSSSRATTAPLTLALTLALTLTQARARARALTLARARARALTLTLTLTLTRCDDGSSKSLGHTPLPDNLTVHVSNFNIEEVPLMTFDAFQVKFKYSATWSDRYAVHPCTINLYDTGKGVGANGKMVRPPFTSPSPSPPLPPSPPPSPSP